MTTSLEEQFDEAMLDVYRRAKSEAGYAMTRFHQMLMERRGLETARSLLHADAVSDGFAAMWERSRLDLTVEALIHDHPELHPLFTDEERETARKRLEDHRYPPVIDPLEGFIGGFPSNVPDWSSEHDKYLGKSLHERARGNSGAES